MENWQLYRRCKPVELRLVLSVLLLSTHLLTSEGSTAEWNENNPSEKAEEIVLNNIIFTNFL